MPISTAPNDPLFFNSWHLLNTGTVGQGSGTAGIDIRIQSAWQKYTGKGVLVGVADDGVDLTHPDLAANIWTRPAGGRVVDAANANLVTGLPVSPDDNHGTPVAGIIAAIGNNGIGGVGEAPDAKIVSYRLLGTGSASAQDTFTQALYDGVQVLNNSWGFGPAFQQSPTVFDDAIAALGTTGRGGLGGIVVFAEGNSRGSTIDGGPGPGTDGGLDQFTGNRFTIAVAAIDNKGVVTDYSSRGSNLLVSAPGGVFDTNLTSFTGITGTDREGPSQGYNRDPTPGGDYVGFNGTSAAAPVVSGVAALILEANPGLGYRDVQEIFAYTARQIDPGAGLAGATSLARTPWVTTHAGNANGGGLKFSTDYGFGLIDAGAAVRLAETWKVAHTEANLIKAEVTQATPGTITTGGIATAQSFSTQFTMTQPAGAYTGFRVDRVEVDLLLVAARPSDLTITLTSPDATTITLVQTPGNAFTFISNDNYNGSSPTAWPGGNGFPLTTPGFWGEKAVGVWTLTISAAANATTAASFTAAQLRVYGDGSDQADLRLSDIITDDFGRLADLETARATLGAGKTAINAAAMTGAVRLDLSALDGSGGTSDLGGRAVTLTGATLKDAFGGAGDDILLGSAAANSLAGGWGNDLLRGGAGNDTLGGGDGDDILDGGLGADAMAGGVGNDQYLIDNQGDMVAEGLAQGTDTAWVGASGWIVGANIEIVRLYGAGTQLTGSAGNEIFVANAGAASAIAAGAGDDTLWGNALAHTLDGGAGDDVIRGQDGASVMTGGLGNDQFVIGNLGAAVVEAANEGIDTAWVAVTGWTNALNVEIARLAAPGAVLLFGSEGNEDLVANQAEGSRIDGNGGNDTLWGSAFADTLNGGAGDDIMRGQGGADVMAGGTGNDQYVVFDSGATVTENADSGYDIVYFAGAGSFTIGENVEEGRLFGPATGLVAGAANNLLAGNNAGLASTLDGGAGDDVIFGTAAADFFIGGFGDDTIYGLGGADIFDYRMAGWGTDLISSFGPGAKLQFEAASGVTAFSQLILSFGGGNTQVSNAGGVILVFGATLGAADFLFA